MPKPLIAIAGSADPTRAYEPALFEPDRARVAAAELGRELAKAGCHIVVYSADPGFIERDVVSGYVKSGAAAPGSIQVHYPASNPKVAEFAERSTHGGLFLLRPDNVDDWETSYYRSLQGVSGVLLLGGGKSVAITGLLAVSHRLPVVAVRAFGGCAARVWRELRADRDLPAQPQVDDMGSPWTDGLAATLAQSLVDQHRARARERRRTVYPPRAMLAGFLFVGSVATLVTGWLLDHHKLEAAFVAVLFFSPLVAGASGAMVRGMVDENAVEPPADADSGCKTAVLGLVAGGISSILYLVAQVVASRTVPLNLPALCFAVVVGFVAGFTSESVFAKLKKSNALSAKPIAVE
jgi:hypothetical protein